MSQRIADKLLAALRHLGVPNEFASKIADSIDFMGESNEESAERDNYEIVIIAKALKSLLKRHSFPMEGDELYTEAYTTPEDVDLDGDRACDPIDDISKEFSHSADYPETGKSLEKDKFWQWLSRMPKFLRGVITFTLPILIYLGMVLLTLTVVGLTVSLLILVIGITVAGIAAFFIGLIYGVSQFYIFPAAAYYEIGMGLALGGLSALLIVLMYWAITKLLPAALKAGIKKLHHVSVRVKKFKADIRSTTAKAGK